MITQNMSERITSLRWLCIILVVLQHSVQWPYFQSSMADFCFEPVFGWIYMVVEYGLGIGIVPVFFIMSGYLYFEKPRKYRDTIVKKSRGLLLPIILWTAIVCIEYLVLKRWTGEIDRFAFLNSSSPMEWFKGIIGDYSNMMHGGIGVPVLYQFWFIRDLFILSLLSPVINWLLQKIPWIYMTVCLALMFFLISPAVAPHALFFYSLGGLCAIREWNFFDIADKYVPWPLVIIGAVAAVIFVHTEGIYCGITTHFLAHMPTFFLLLKLSKFLIANKKVYEFTRKMAPQSMFLYGAHTYMLINVIGMMLVSIIDVTSTFGIIVFFLLLFFVDVCICTAAGIAVRKYLPKTFSLLSGGR